MKRTKWTEQSAANLLVRKGATITGKSIRIEKDPNKRRDVMGNGSSGAIDFLVNHCGYYCNV
jgi:hypothetical protein